MRKALSIFLSIFIGLIIFFSLFLIYTTVVDYKPEASENISTSKGSVISVNDTVNIFNWNIGYSGLGDDMSFFYDGGEEVRTSKDRTIENLNQIRAQLIIYDSIDFYLLQEVDKNSHRSYNVNQFDSISVVLDKYHGSFTNNYKVPFIPIPLNNPMGKVNSGLASFSNHEAFSTDRFSFPGNYAWPKGLFLLDRCFMVQRIYTSNGKELLIVNTHNSAYDDGTLRKQQMAVMKVFLLNEYSKGNYIVVGGDWNQDPPAKGKPSVSSEDGHLTRIRIAHDFMPSGWQWEYSEDIPTNRILDKPYTLGETVTTIIDFFLLSPNVKAIEQKNIDLQFKNSDHHPVLMSFVFL